DRLGLRNRKDDVKAHDPEGIMSADSAFASSYESERLVIKQLHGRKNGALQLLQEIAGMRSSQVKLAKLRCPIGELNVLRYQEMIEVSGYLGGHARCGIKPQGLRSPKDEEVGHDPALDVGQESLASMSWRKALDIIGAKVVKEASGVPSC